MKPPAVPMDARQIKALQDLQAAVELDRRGLAAEAAEAYARIVKKNPGYFDALHFFGLFKFRQGQHQEALRLIEKALRENPRSLNALNSLAVVNADMRNFGEALKAFDRLLQRDPENTSAIFNKAQCLYRLGRFAEVIGPCTKLFSSDPSRTDAALLAGAAALDARETDVARGLFERVREIAPENEIAWCGLARCCARTSRYEEALVMVDRALSFNPDYADGWTARGQILHNLRRGREASEAFERAVGLAPEAAEAWSGHGQVMASLGMHAEAVSDHVRALALRPDFPFLKGSLVHEKLLSCDWTGLSNLIRTMEGEIRAGRPTTDPFSWISVATSDRSMQRVARTWREAHYPRAHERPKTVNDASRRVRIGYLSGDFRQHPVGQLMAPIIRGHDRTHFEVVGFDDGLDDGSAIRSEIRSSFDRVIDVCRLGDEDVTGLVAAEQIDVLVDLQGYSGQERGSVFARRPAPVQVNFLGFPSTLGADYIDYIIADRIVLPSNSFSSFDEKVVWLPNSFFPSNRLGEVSAHLSREEVGLPPSAVVFCSFVSPFKINPEVFDSWMAILSRVDHGVLWLRDPGEAAAANLRREAAARKVEPERIIFAPKVDFAEHLARHRLADLFLDTWPYGAHTTASDALWAGLPVLTCTGRSFASRVGTSLLAALGVPELIASSPGDYERLAVELAKDRNRLVVIRDRIAAARTSSSLFDTQAYIRKLEAAFTEMAGRHRAGLPPGHIEVV